jgi:hypothetical protein
MARPASLVLLGILYEGRNAIIAAAAEESDLELVGSLRSVLSPYLAPDRPSAVRRVWRSPWLLPVALLVTASTSLLVLVAMDWPRWPIALAVVMSCGLGSLALALYAERLRLARKSRRTFSRYMSPDVVHDLAGVRRLAGLPVPTQTRWERVLFGRDEA